MSNEPYELRDLQQAMARFEARCAADLGRIEALTHELAADKARHLTRRATWLPAVELAASGCALAFVCGGFAYPGSLVFLGCLVTVAAVLLVLMFSLLRQIVLLRRVDHAAPVLVTQQCLARVAALRVREWRWVLLLSPVLWTPFFVVAIELPLRMLARDALHDVFSADYVLLSLLIGGAVSLGLYLGCRWLSRRLQGTSFARRLIADLSGRSLVAAREFLTRVDELERG